WIHAAAESVEETDPVFDRFGLNAFGECDDRPIDRKRRTDDRDRADDGCCEASRKSDADIHIDLLDRSAMHQGDRKQPGHAPEDDIPRRRFAPQERQLVDADIAMEPEAI